MAFHVCYIRLEAWEPTSTVSFLVVWQVLDLRVTKKVSNVDSDPKVPDLFLGLFVILPDSLGMRSNQLDEIARRI